MRIRTQLKAGGSNLNHNETLAVRTALKAGGRMLNHNETLQVRSGIKAGRIALNHNETLRVRTSVKAGKIALNHNEALQQQPDRHTVSMRRQPRTTVRKEDRLELLVVRAGLRAGARRSRYSR